MKNLIFFILLWVAIAVGCFVYVKMDRTFLEHQVQKEQEERLLRQQELALKEGDADLAALQIEALQFCGNTEESWKEDQYFAQLTRNK